MKEGKNVAPMDFAEYLSLLKWKALFISKSRCFDFLGVAVNHRHVIEEEEKSLKNSSAHHYLFIYYDIISSFMLLYL